MGGQDWELWIDALDQAGVLADGARTVAFSYIGTDITWPIYWHGALGRAKVDLDQTAQRLDARLRKTGGTANVAVLKSVVPSAMIMKWCIDRMVGRSALGLASVISTVSGSTALTPVICLAIELTLDPVFSSRWRFSE